MGILIQHGTDFSAIGDALSRANRARELKKEGKRREINDKAARMLAEKQDARASKESDQRIRESQGREQSNEEERRFRESERARLGQARGERVKSQGSRFEAMGGERTLQREPNTQGPEIQIPEGLPRDLWPDYFDTKQRLDQMTDPGAREEELQSAHKRWSSFVHMRGIDQVLGEMSHDIDTGALQGDPEGAPDPREGAMIDELRGSMDKLSSYREQVAQDPDSFDPGHIDRIRSEFTGLKTKLADLDFAKGQRESAVLQIDEMAGKWAGSRKMQEGFARLKTRLQRNVIKPDEALKEADKLAREPEMYGEGKPFMQADPQVQRSIRKEAFEAAKDVLAGSDNWKTMTPSERSAALLEATQQWEPTIARQYGWDSSANPEQLQATGAARAQDRFSRPMEDDGAAAEGMGPQPQNGAAAPPQQMTVEQLTQQYRAAGLDETWAPWFAKASAEGATVQQISDMLRRLRATGNPHGRTPEEEEQATKRRGFQPKTPGSEMNRKPGGY